MKIVTQSTVLTSYDKINIAKICTINYHLRFIVLNTQSQKALNFGMYQKTGFYLCVGAFWYMLEHPNSLMLVACWEMSWLMSGLSHSSLSCPEGAEDWNEYYLDTK